MHKKSLTYAKSTIKTREEHKIIIKNWMKGKTFLSTDIACCRLVEEWKHKNRTPGYIRKLLKAFHEMYPSLTLNLFENLDNSIDIYRETFAPSNMPTEYISAGDKEKFLSALIYKIWTGPKKYESEQRGPMLWINENLKLPGQARTRGAIAFNNRNALLYSLILMATGLRGDSIAHLRFRDIEFTVNDKNEATIYVHHFKNKLRSGKLIEITYMVDPTRENLFYKLYNHILLTRNKNKTSKDFIFITPGISPDGLLERIRLTLRKATGKKLQLHGFRHAITGELLDKKIGSEKIMKFLFHKVTSSLGPYAVKLSREKIAKQIDPVKISEQDLRRIESVFTREEELITKISLGGFTPQPLRIHDNHARWSKVNLTF